MNSTGKAISRTFDDRYGILELKLAPTSTTASTACTANSSNASQSTAGGTSRVLYLGPDFISQAGGY